MPEAVREGGVQHQARLCRGDISVSKVFQRPDHEYLQGASSTRLERGLCDCCALAAVHANNIEKTAMLTKVQDMERVIR